MNDLWEHQQKAVEEIESAWASGIRSVCQQAPTGAGKTRILRKIIDNHAKTKKIIYIIAHRESLVQQLSDELEKIGIRHGIIKSGTPYIRYRTQVCSMQTLVRRLDKLEEADMIIIDECHHIMSNSYLKILEHWPDALVLGVTATPSRLSGEPLSDVFQKLIPGPQPSELMEKGVLCNYDYYAPDDVDMTGARHQQGDFKKSEAQERSDNKKVIGSILEHYKKLADHEPAICCCVSIEHAEHVAEQFCNAGYRAVAIHSKMSGSYESAINGLRTGEVEILCQVEVLSEGVDIKGAKVLIMARPTESIVIFLQQVGRVLRSAPGKEKAIIIDHVSNFTRHGLPDDFRIWSLDGKIKKQEASEYKRCPQCQRPVPLSARQCPYCGFSWKEAEKAERDIPKEHAGELVNILERRKQQNDFVLAIMRQAISLAHAVEIAKKHGKTSKQAWFVWVKMMKKSIKNP